MGINPPHDLMFINPRHFPLRGRDDRNAKKARCACGWEGPWRSTPSTGHRRRDARARYQQTHADFEEHLKEVS